LGIAHLWSNPNQKITRLRPKCAGRTDTELRSCFHCRLNQAGGSANEATPRGRSAAHCVKRIPHFRYLCQFINFGPENFIARNQIAGPGAASRGGRQHLLQPLICFEQNRRIQRLSSAIILWLDSVGMRGKSASATVDRVVPFCERLTSY
jgi:hypothetical protein